MTPAEIANFVARLADGSVPDYQAAAWLMAVFFRGMSPAETAALTEAMVASGERVDLAEIPGIKVDKHSSGGVGDKTTLVAAPLAAACGVPVAKLSGRGLGHTGGTLDKLEAFPGLRTNLSREAFVGQVKRIGLAIAGQTADLVPADKRLYALRDVTATVDSIPLIAASIMSKKLAAGADAFVLDVKAGRGALLPDLDAARRLAQAMLDIARLHGKKTTVLVTAMESPLGRAVGNALEVREAVDALRGAGPADLVELSVALAAEMLVLAGRSPDITMARCAVTDALQSGKALEKLAQMVAAQGGDTSVIADPTLLPQAPVRREVRLPSSGYVASIDALSVGVTTMQLGAGRQTKDDAIDLAVGVELLRKPGEHVGADEPVALVYARSESAATEAADRIARAYRVQPAPMAVPPVILARLG